MAWEGIAPVRAGVAGDWHGNTLWACHAATQMARRLEGEDRKLILHAGDFGIWPGDGPYLRELGAALADGGAELAFVDGNHEDHARLASMLPEDWDGSPVPMAERIWWLPRGTRWEWHGRRWAAMGGAVSVDRAWRREGRDWWPAERISPMDHARVVEGGPADVVLAHDVPHFVGLRLGPSGWPAEDIALSERHRRLVTAIGSQLEPSFWIHGHYHQGWPAWRSEDAPWGAMKTASLDCDGTQGNWGVLDVRSMEWER